MSVGRIETVHAFGRYAGGIVTAADLGGRDVVVWTSPDELAAGLSDVEVMVGVGFPSPDWAGATRLRLIQIGGAGIDGLLPATNLSPGVLVANARGLSAAAMSEFALATVLALAKRLPAALRHQAAHEWQRERPMMLGGRRAVVLGAGAVGRGVARMLRALGMTVAGVRRTPVDCEDFDETHGPEALEHLLDDAAVVVIALASTPATRGLLDESRLERCAQGCLVVNVARGDVIDEVAVDRLLRSGHLGGAALDVFATEPLAPSSPLWDAPNLIVTPHISWSSPDYGRRVGELVAENIDRLERGVEVLNLVESEFGY